MSKLKEKVNSITIYKIESEWNIDQEFVNFTSKNNALEWIKINPTLNELYGDEFEELLDELMNDGLITIIPLKLIGD